MTRGLLFVSFGTSHEATRVKTIDVIEEEVRSAFPDRALYSAWTSTRIIAKVRAERGEHHDTIDEALAKMAADGVNDLLVTTTCLMDGFEMAKVRGAVEAWSAAHGCPALIADPLLSTREDRAVVARAVQSEFAHLGDGDALMLMGHGSAHASNAVYAQLQDELHALGCKRCFIATVEGTPTFDDVWPLVEASGAARVYLAPLMIVAGDHATNDLAGAQPDSWASKVAAHGCVAEPVLKGLGEYLAIRVLVRDHARAALLSKEGSSRG